MKQIYSDYTPEDFDVWKILFERQMTNFSDAASADHLRGLECVKFEAGRIPHFEETNQILQKTTGWQLSVVPGIIEDYTFFELMANRYFPATAWLRKMEELDYLEEPDMFHDVFAHVPLLTNQPFVDFLEGISKIGLSYRGNEEAIHLLSRLYWYTIEFGLIQEKEGLRIYGAGILSSSGETKYCLSDEPPKHSFDVKSIMETPYSKNVYQDQYFVIDSYDQLFNSISDIKAYLLSMFKPAAAMLG